jgi:hypothetical protein
MMYHSPQIFMVIFSGDTITHVPLLQQKFRFQFLVQNYELEPKAQEICNIKDTMKRTSLLGVLTL